MPTQFTTEDQQRQQWTEVYDTEHGVRKAFYCYEKSNALASNPSYIVVDYALEGGITGKVTVPFTNTDESGNKTPVNIVRNNLYRVVLGDGDPIRPGADVEVKIIDEPWEVIDLPVVVGKPEQGEPGITQAEANAALLVNKFARTPVGNQLPEGCNLLDAIESNQLVFADDSVEPYALAKTDSDLTSYLTNSWTTSVNGELYRMPTFEELIDFLPDISNASTIATFNDCEVKEFSLFDYLSIIGQETHGYVIYSNQNDISTYLTKPVYILTGLIDKTATGGSIRDHSDAQAKIQRLRFDSNNQMFIMDVMALRTMDLSQVIVLDDTGSSRAVNMSELSNIFDTEDKLTFKFPVCSAESWGTRTYHFKTTSKVYSSRYYYQTGLGHENQDLSILNYKNTLTFDNYSLMLIKAD